MEGASQSKPLEPSHDNAIEIRRGLRRDTGLDVGQTWPTLSFRPNVSVELVIHFVKEAGDAGDYSVFPAPLTSRAARNLVKVGCQERSKISTGKFPLAPPCVSALDIVCLVPNIPWRILSSRFSFFWRSVDLICLSKIDFFLFFSRFSTILWR